jgi:uncharacterized protein YoxC
MVTSNGTYAGWYDWFKPSYVLHSFVGFLSLYMPGVSKMEMNKTREELKNDISNQFAAATEEQSQELSGVQSEVKGLGASIKVCAEAVGKIQSTFQHQLKEQDAKINYLSLTIRQSSSFVIEKIAQNDQYFEYQTQHLTNQMGGVFSALNDAQNQLKKDITKEKENYFQYYQELNKKISNSFHAINEKIAQNNQEIDKKIEEVDKKIDSVSTKSNQTREAAVSVQENIALLQTRVSEHRKLNKEIFRQLDDHEIRLQKMETVLGIAVIDKYDLD